MYLLPAVYAALLLVDVTSNESCIHCHNAPQQSSSPSFEIIRLPAVSLCPPVVPGSAAPLIDVCSLLPFANTMNSSQLGKCFPIRPKSSLNLSPWYFLADAPSAIVPPYAETSFAPSHEAR